MAFGALRRIRNECGPMINIPVRGVLAGIRIQDGLVIRGTVATSDDYDEHDEEEGDQALYSIVSYLWHALHLSLF